MSSWLPYAIGVGGAIVGPSGIAWAVLNYRTDRDGKRISQTGEIVAMFQAYIDEMEKALVRAEAALVKEQTRGNGAMMELAACREECSRYRRELHDLRQAQLRWESRRGRDDDVG